MTDPWHCPNGHLAFETLRGHGCVVYGCDHRVATMTDSKETRRTKVHELKKSGQSNAEIAAKFERSESWVRSMLVNPKKAKMKKDKVAK